MKRPFKKTFVALIAATTMAMSMGVVHAGAYQVVSSTYLATFKWGAGYSEMINNSTTVRLASAYTNIYKDLTGDYVDQKYTSGNIGYNKSVYGGSSDYSSNGHNFECHGGIYRANSQYSPFDWSQTHYVD